MTRQIRIKQIAGTDHFQPACNQSVVAAVRAGSKTLSRDALKTAARAGFSILIVNSAGKPSCELRFA